ncbi:MAG TPA: zf-HC2 domain-containing protein [Spirochaetota bacterium]|nr:zf-HC2 domain-containing protein [Spirochaetota bacterium]
MFSCKKYSLMISRNLDNDLDFKEQNILREHLRNCKHCQNKEYELSLVKKVFKSDSINKSAFKSERIINNKKNIVKIIAPIAALFVLIFGITFIFTVIFSNPTKNTNEQYNAKYFPLGSFIYYQATDYTNSNNEYANPMDTYFTLIDN